MTTTAESLVSALRGFNVSAEVAEIQSGAAVDRYALRLAPGVKVKQVTALADDIALAIGAPAVRVLVIPGTGYVGVEVPAANRETISLEHVAKGLEQDHPLRFPVGVDVAGNGISARLDKLPHLIVAGTTGSGKSVALTTILTHLVTRNDPADLQLILVDPKRVEMASFAGLPHLARPPATDIHAAVEALDEAVAEMDERWQMLERRGVKQISDLEDRPPFLVVVIDELADLMMTAGKRVEPSLVRLLQLGRAAGIHVMLATQRPSREVLSGLITANVPSRLVFSVQSHTDSGVALGQTGAERLLGQGDALWWPSGASQPERVQGLYVSGEEVEEMLEPLRRVEVEEGTGETAYECPHHDYCDGTECGQVDEPELQGPLATLGTPGDVEGVRAKMYARLREGAAVEAARTAPTAETPVEAEAPAEPDPYIAEMSRQVDEVAREFASVTALPGDSVAERTAGLRPYQDLDAVAEAAYARGRAHGEMLANPSLTSHRVMLGSDWALAILVGVGALLVGVIAMPILPIPLAVWAGWALTRRRTDMRRYAYTHGGRS